ncbi:cytochrome P450, partial [Zooshikella sp. RANM57]|uniref:cytochrome P450 n=1 Tax=Zooshikella sp. RANM57 TaxID=3425863 RepID=UPI003D7013BF
KDFEIHGVEIHANDNIGLCLGAANRDPRIFESPHIFNIHRKENLTLEFGHGPHICLGKHLAHLEGEAAITEIIKRWPGIQVAISEDEIEWERDAVFLKIKALPVRLV